MPEFKRLLKVFLCHASQDKPSVRELAQHLSAEGWIDPWLDEKKLLPGQDWRLKIEEAVETSDIVIICLSSNSVGKEGFVQKELRYAREISLEKLEESIFLIPLRIDECDVPRGLRFYQWADYFGEKKDEAYKALLESLRLRYEQKLKIEEQEREVAEIIAKEKAKHEKEEQERQETQKKAHFEAGERTRKEKDEREQKETEEQAKSVGVEFDSLRDNTFRNELKNSLHSYDPERLVVCPECGNKVKAKNLSTHINKNHNNQSVQGYGDTLAKSSRQKKSNKQRNEDTRQVKKVPSKYSTTVAVIFRISGEVDKRFNSKIETLLMDLDVHYYIMKESLLSALFSGSLRNTVRYSPYCLKVANLIKNRLYSQGYRNKIETVSFKPAASEVREYGENIVIFQLERSAFRS